jgi:type II secretory pathway pseudopilin PulG
VKRPRGATLLEVAAAMGVLAMGIAAVGSLVLVAKGQNRRTLSMAQAEAVAQRELEHIEALGCNNASSDTAFCDNVRALDRTGYDVQWTLSGAPTVGGTAVGPVRTYHVDIDVDGPGNCNGVPCFEGAETGAPLLGRTLVPGQPAPHVLNVRVTVSWAEPNRPRQAVALQTRVAP